MTASRMAETQSDTCNVHLATSPAEDRRHVPFASIAVSELHGLLPHARRHIAPEHPDIVHEYIGADPELADPELAEQGTMRQEPTRVRFAGMILLDKQEAFNACSSIAEAGDALVSSGHYREGEALESLFSLLEGRLVSE
ncbi:MAG: hypothetical protein M1399_04785 [Actinobacteria bacterium]|nr:hypothetical protein [Actinomycetota bacterium]MCL5447252.1 hypothetical protein [Actinomycetota bacterium]